jgi:hypothetical protein
MKTPRSIEQKIVLDAVLIAVAAGLLVLARPSGIAPAEQEVPTAFVGFYLIYLGVLFLLSYYFSEASYVLRALIWVCEHFSHPRGRYMAFFYFGLSLLVGGGALLSAFGFLK